MLSVLPLRDTVVYPGGVVPLSVGQERSVRLVDEVVRGDRRLAVVAQLAVEAQPAGAGDYLAARLEPLAEAPPDEAEVPALRHAIITMLHDLSRVDEDVPAEVAENAESLADAALLLPLVAAGVRLPLALRQDLLELDPLEARLRRLLEALQHELAVRKVGRSITAKTRERLTDARRRALLREQLRSIQEQLGDGTAAAELDTLRKRLVEAGLPEEARKEADRELDRLAALEDGSLEGSLIRTWLDWLVSLPWKVTTGVEVDVDRAREVLDSDHYDVEKIKQRILEHLAVRGLRRERGVPEGTEGATEPILCFVGPPGVGKTSLGLSIARAGPALRAHLAGRTA